MALEEQLATVVALAIEKATQPLLTRIALLESREALHGRDGLPGVPGTQGAKGLDGEPGRDGVNGEPGPAGAPGERGETGPQGPQGARGEPGTPGVDGETGSPGERGEAGEKGFTGAEGPEGKPGRDGRDGLQGAVGEKGLDGKDGRDGVDGQHGKDGADGLGFDDLDLVTDARGCFLRFSRGDQVKEFRLPVQRNCGVYKAGTVYDVGDSVTWAGHFWTATAETSEKPGDGVTAWQMVVRRGDQGKAGPKGEPGKDGRTPLRMDVKTGRFYFDHD